MKKNILVIAAIAIMIVIGMSACTDSTMASFSSYGSEFTVKCYSGGKVIYDATSTGKVATLAQSDGWEFKDAADGKFVRVSGTCVVKQK